MTIAGYVPAIGETDLDKITRSIRNLYENGAATADLPVLGTAANDVPQLDANGFLPISGAWTKLSESIVSSAVATIDITETSGFPSAYDTFCLELLQIVPATDDTRLSLRIGTGVTPTWQAGAGAYGWGFNFVGTGGGVSGQGSTDANAIADRIALTAGTTATLGVAGSGISGSPGASVRCFFNKPNGSTYPLFSYQSAWLRGGGVSGLLGASGAGNYGSASAITGLRLLFNSGNIASGTVRLWGIRT